MATDSEILAGLVSDFESGRCTEEKIATLRKYAAIARACEAGTWKLVPVEAAVETLEAMAVAFEFGETQFHDLIGPMGYAYSAMCAAAPQFQEEGK